MQIDTTARYKKFKEIISQRIKRGEFNSLGKIPSERQLAEEYAISQVTVNKAISELISEGYLYRKQGIGTFIQPYGRKRTNRIAAIVYRNDTPYYSKVIRGIEETAKENSYRLFLCNSEGKINKEKLYLKKIMPEVDGILLSPALDKKRNSPTAEKLLGENFPFVLFSNIPSSKNIEKIHYVISDNQRGGYLATKHLINLGHRRIVFLAIKDYLHCPDFRDRFLGYKKALSEIGIPLQKNFILETTSFDALHGYKEDGYQIIDKIISMSEKPTAVFAIGDSLAIGLLRALHERGIQVPEDISLCGFDNIDLARQWGIELTTIAQPTYQIGKKAVEILVQECRGEIKGAQHIVLPVKLKLRETSGAYLSSKKEKVAV